MNADRLISQMERFPDLVRSAISCFKDSDLRWRPADDAWSVLEILCHLADEEVSDFCTRLRLTLESPGADWPAIDPVGWATSRDYNNQNPALVLDRFDSERRYSVQWLRTLNSPDWTATHHHPKFGAITAGQLLASWAAHDALHLRQIAKRLFQLTVRDAGSFTTEYAGSWTA